MQNTKWDYFWNRYKVHAIVIVVSACVVGSSLHSMLTQKETVLSAVYINAFPNVDDEVFMDGFEAYLGVTSQKEQAVLDSTYYIDKNYNASYAATYEQKFSAMAAAGNLDVVISDEKYFNIYAQQGFFQDLSLLLTPEQMEKYQDAFFYCDLPHDETEAPVPIGINITNAPKIIATASYPNTTAYYGIIASSKYPDNALSYLAYLETE